MYHVSIHGQTIKQYQFQNKANKQATDKSSTRFSKSEINQEIGS